jgi:hypothetical protein
MKRQNANYKTRSEAQQEEDAPWLMWEVIRAQETTRVRWARDYVFVYSTES